MYCTEFYCITRIGYEDEFNDEELIKHPLRNHENYSNFLPFSFLDLCKVKALVIKF